jgi:hypothetical protein
MSRDFASRLSHLRRWRRNLISYSAIPFSTYCCSGHSSITVARRSAFGRHSAASQVPQIRIR